MEQNASAKVHIEGNFRHALAPRSSHELCKKSYAKDHHDSCHEALHIGADDCKNGV